MIQPCPPVNVALVAASPQLAGALAGALELLRDVAVVGCATRADLIDRRAEVLVGDPSSVGRVAARAGSLGTVLVAWTAAGAWEAGPAIHAAVIDPEPQLLAQAVHCAARRQLYRDPRLGQIAQALRLTPAQAELVPFLLRGEPYQAISRTLCISEAAVRKRASSIIQELGVSTRELRGLIDQTLELTSADGRPLRAAGAYAGWQLAS